MSNTQPSVISQAPEIEEILAEFLQRLDQGEALAESLFLAEHPEVAEELRSYLEGCQELAQLLGGEGAEEQACRSTPAPGRTLVEPGEQFKSRLLGDYELLEELGRGGMGVVYKARQISLNRIVALKMMRAGLQASSTELRRFQEEAGAIALLEHPGIIAIYEVGEWKVEGNTACLPYFCMRYVSGGSLAQQLPRWCRKPREASKLIVQVARAVHYAHQRGILHRDLKPANILLDENDDPVVTDFGLAKRVSDPHKQDNEVDRTDPGALVGTPTYMAPEQALGKGVTTATDVHGLGAILYELLTGEPPFRGETKLATLLKVREEVPRPVRERNQAVDRDLDIICLKCLQKDPEQRYPNALDLAEDLERWLRGEIIRARCVGLGVRLWKWARRRPLQIAVLALLLLNFTLGLFGGVMGWELGRTRSQRDQLALAREQTELAHQNAEHHLYITRVVRAQLEWTAANPAKARTILDLCPRSIRSWEWYHVHRLCHPELRTLQGHRGSVSSVAFCPEGKRLVSSSQDGTVRIWEVASGREIRTLSTHPGPVHGVTFSPEGTRLVRVGAGASEAPAVSRVLHIYDAESGALLHSLRGHTDTITSVAFSFSGRILASSSRDQTIRLWDARSGSHLCTLQGHTSTVSRIAFSPDGQTLASAGRDSSVRLWHVQSGKELHVLKAHSNPVLNVAFSHQGDLLASVCQEGILRVWNTNIGQEVLTIRGPQSPCPAIAFSPTGNYLAIAGLEGTVHIWDLHNGQYVQKLQGHLRNVRSLAYSPDGTLLASAGHDRTIKLWKVSPFKGNRTLIGHAGGVKSVAVHRDRFIASAGVDRTLRLWQPEGGHSVLWAGNPKQVIFQLAFSPEGRFLASCHNDGSVHLWQVSSRTLLRSFRATARSVWAVAFSPEGQHLVAASLDHHLYVWEVPTGRLRYTLTGHRQHPTAVAWSPDGKWIVSASGSASGRQQPGEIRVWDADRGLQLFSIQAHTDIISGLAFSPDSRQFASSSYDKTAKLWNTLTGNEIRTLTGHNHYLSSVCFSPDGQRLATSGFDYSVKLWVPQTGQETITLYGKRGYSLKDVRFSPEGHQLVAASHAGTIHVWDATPLPGT